MFEGSLSIGINDAERIYPTDITVFHEDWVKLALAESGPKAQLYVTSTDFRLDGVSVIYAPHVALGQENADLMMQRLLVDDFVIEDVLLFSALQIARQVAKFRGRKQTVYLVGFDFRAELGSAHSIGKTYEPGNVDYRRLRIDIQENFLLNALYMLRESELAIVHVGDRSYSGKSVPELIDEFAPRSSEVRRWQVAVVAELTTNHFGDCARLERMVRAAKAAGANYVKVQKRDVETFYSKDQLDALYQSPFGRTFREYRNQLELKENDFEFLDRLCRRLGIGWFASALDLASYRFVSELGSAMIKLPSTISEHREYLSTVANECELPIVLSTGMTTLEYERWVLETFRSSQSLYLLQCNSAYPTPADDCNVGVVRHYDRLRQTRRHIVPGYSSHDEGWFGSALAVAAGARMVEKHVKLGNTDWAHFDAVALDLTTPAFRDYVAKVREAEIIVGSEEKTVAPSEHHKYWVNRKVL